MAISCRQPGDEAIIRHGCAPAPCARRAQLFVLGATVVGSSMAFIDGTVVNVALPVLQDELGATVAALIWRLGGYDSVLLFAMAASSAGAVSMLIAWRRASAT